MPGCQLKRGILKIIWQPGFKKVDELKESPMRDLIFKNLISSEKKRRIISSSEIMDKEGVRSIIRRHFVYILKEIKGEDFKKPDPYLYVLKERRNKEHKEKFFCRIKGSVCAINEGRPLLILFMHSLKITLTPAPTNLIKT